MEIWGSDEFVYGTDSSNGFIYMYTYPETRGVAYIKYVQLSTTQGFFFLNFKKKACDLEVMPQEAPILWPSDAKS